VAQTDYNFETPSTSLLTSTSTVIDQPGMDSYEEFDYPGDYSVKGNGETLTRVRMEEEEAGYEVVQGASGCCTFTPCGRFTLENHDVDSECGDYVVTSIQHSATEASYDASAGGLSYSNSFSCIRASVTFRPPRLTPKSQVRGPQTAVVTGPGGEEIYVDQYGRVKVQFFWTDKGRRTRTARAGSASPSSGPGKNWGFVAHPRIGQEVIVDFLEGTPTAR
jgi:type VI secretion system secreted protein VgrG